MICGLEGHTGTLRGHLGTLGGCPNPNPEVLLDSAPTLPADTISSIHQCQDIICTETKH